MEKFFGEPEANVFLSSEGEEGVLNWLRGNSIREIVNNRIIFLSQFSSILQYVQQVGRREVSSSVKGCFCLR